MQRSTNLGMSLGQMLSGAFNKNGYEQGQLDGMKKNQMQSTIEHNNAATDKARIDAAQTQQQIDNSSDDGLSKSLVAGIQNGINGDNAANDFKSYLNGSYQPREQQGPGMQPGMRMPTPDYVSAFPELQQKFSALKQMLAVGDKNIGNISKSIQGDQRNQITKNLNTATPMQAAEIGQRTAAIEGNVNPLEMMKAALTYGLVNGQNTPNDQNALLLSQGKTRYDNMGGTGTFDNLTGNQSLNDLGLASVIEKKAQANQANAGATENLAQAGLAGTRSQHIKEGKGDGSNATMRDMSQIRDDIRGEFNTQFPINSMTGTRKGAPAYRDFEKNWLKQFNVDEGAYYRQSGSKATEPAPTKTKSNPAYDEYMAAYTAAKGNPAVQKKITERARKNGVVK